jgi:hypothetical protein
VSFESGQCLTVTARESTTARSGGDVHEGVAAARRLLSARTATGADRELRRARAVASLTPAEAGGVGVLRRLFK